MVSRLRFALWLALATAFVLGLFAIVGFALWFDLQEDQRVLLRAMLKEKAPLLLILAFLLPFLLGALLRWSMAAWPLAASRMAEEVALIHTVNPSHRVSLVGAGMKTHPGVAATMFESLAAADVNIEMISTSAIRISCVVAEGDVERAVRVLHDAFQLGEEPS